MNQDIIVKYVLSGIGAIQLSMIGYAVCVMIINII